MRQLGKAPALYFSLSVCPFGSGRKGYTVAPEPKTTGAVEATATKHTPGPWEVAYNDDFEVAEVQAPCHEHPHCHKTIVFGPREYDRPFQCSIGPNSKANAHLIAAAPELLAACREALDWYGPDGDHIGEPWRSQLLAAIAKAEIR